MSAMGVEVADVLNSLECDYSKVSPMDAQQRRWKAADLIRRLSALRAPPVEAVAWQVRRKMRYTGELKFGEWGPCPAYAASDYAADPDGWEVRPLYASPTSPPAQGVDLPGVHPQCNFPLCKCPGVAAGDAKCPKETPSEKERERLGDDDERSKRVSKWVPTTDLMMLRRMGKTSEECAELMCVLARCIIQGIDEVDPSSGKVNRQRLIEELADVQAQINCTVGWLNLDSAYIAKRCETKEGYMRQWEGLFGDTPSLRQADAPVGWVSADERLPAYDGPDVLCWSDSDFQHVLKAGELRDQIAFGRHTCKWKFWRELPAAPRPAGSAE